MKQNKKNSKVIQYRRPIHINIGVIIFLFIFIYLAYSVISYMTSDRIQVYEVGEEVSLSRDQTYTGLILREELVANTDQTGYVNYYIREGSRAAVEDVVYSIDENGQFTELLSSSGSSESSSLSRDNLTSLKKTLSSFISMYDETSFYKTYELKYEMENKLLNFLSTNSVNDLDNLGIDPAYFHTVPAAESGIVEYYVDGFEDLSAENVTMDNFKRNNYNKNSIRSGELLESGSPVYKTITSEQWQIIIALDAETAEKYKDTTSISVTFPEKDLSTSVNFEIFTGTDGNTYGKLSLGRYMVQYAGQRYLEVTIHDNDVKSGLKIPKSAVIESSFYTIPKEYLTTGGNSDSKGFNQEIYNADGTSIQFITPQIYYVTDTDYYVSADDVPAGTVLRYPDSANKSSTVGSTATVQGVYNVNKGYAVFKAVEVLDQDNDYYIVKRGTSYGLSIYDHILLDGSKGAPGEMIY